MGPALDTALAAMSLVLNAIFGGAQMAGILADRRAKAESNSKSWINEKAANRAAVGGYFQLAMAGNTFQALGQLLTETHKISEVYPINPRAEVHQQSGLERDDFDRFEDYHSDMLYHAEILAIERDIVAHYLASSGADDRSCIDAGILQELEAIEANLEELRRNENITIRAVVNDIMKAFRRTEDRLAKELILRGLLAGAPEPTAPASDSSVASDVPPAARQPAEQPRSTPGKRVSNWVRRRPTQPAGPVPEGATGGQPLPTPGGDQGQQGPSRQQGSTTPERPRGPRRGGWGPPAS